MIYIVFGLPGVGKTFVGKILEKDFGFYQHDGDVDLPDDMRLTLSQNGKVTDDMRDEFFQNILGSLERLDKKYKNIVVAQTFIKEKYREWVLEKFPKAKFLLVVTPDDIRESRLGKRIDYPLDLEYSRQMVMNFDEPHIPHIRLDNSQEGAESVKEQLEKILNRFQDDSEFREENQ